MGKTISAMYARKNFGLLLNEVSLLKNSYVVERSGRPMAALVPVDLFEGTNGPDPNLVRAIENLVKRIKGPRSKKLDKAIAEVGGLLGLDLDQGL